MTGHHHVLHHHRRIALAIVLLALLARLLIPTGFMPVVQDGRLVMALCAGQGPAPMLHAAMPGMDHAAASSGYPADHEGSEHMKDGPCAFAGVSLAATAAADPVLLALAILFVVTTVFRWPQSSPTIEIRFRWPPRTGPPLRV
jgi:hypothetical protein